jgi:hypothetical protein
MSAVRSLLGEERTSRGQPTSVAIDPERSFSSFEGKAKSLIYINCISAGRASYWRCCIRAVAMHCIGRQRKSARPGSTNMTCHKRRYEA